MLHLCSKHYVTHLTDPAFLRAQRLPDRRSSWTNGANEHGQDPGREDDLTF